MDEKHNMEPPVDAAEVLNSMATSIERDDPAIEQASSEYLRSWNHLVSTTNWEKGRIIHRWREALVAVDAPQSAYCDEAWSRRVGNVTPQHVGRLRRVFNRFYDEHTKYEGLFWSHFQAALDWDDAEMWLEGAVQNGWSVAAMRDRRWEALGAADAQRPRDEDIILAELDEDASLPEDIIAVDERPSIVRPAGNEEDDEELDADSPEHEKHGDDEPAGPPAGDLSADTPDDSPAVASVRPFEDVPELPADLSDAVERMKLAIIRHRMAGWRDVYCDDVLAALNALRQLALAPPEES